MNLKFLSEGNKLLFLAAVRFINAKSSIIMFHKPHPENTLKRYVLDQVIATLVKEDLL